MHVARLRQKLGEYYRTEGVDDPIVVDLPKGGFQVVFEPRKAVFEQVVIEEPAPARGWRWREVALAVCLVVALAAIALLATRKTPTAEPVAPWTPEIQ